MINININKNINKNMCIVFSLIGLLIILYPFFKGPLEGFLLKNKSLGRHITTYNTQGYTTPFIYREKILIHQPLPISNRWIKIFHSNETARNPTFSFQLEIYPSRDGKLIGSQTFLGGIINGVLSNSNLSELRVLKSMDLLPFDQAAFRKNNNQIELWLHTTKDTVGNIDGEIIINQPYNKESDKLTIWLNGNNETVSEKNFIVTDVKNVKLSKELDHNTEAIDILNEQNTELSSLSNNIFDFQKDKIDKYEHQSHKDKYAAIDHSHNMVRYGDLIYMKNTSYPVYLDICGRGSCYTRWDVSTSYSPYREANSRVNQVNATGIWKIYKMDRLGAPIKNNTDSIKYGDKILMVNMYLDAEYYLDAGCGPGASGGFLVGLYENHDRQPGTNSSKWTILRENNKKKSKYLSYEDNIYLQTDHVDRRQYLDMSGSASSGCSGNYHSNGTRAVGTSPVKRESCVWKILKKGTIKDFTPDSTSTQTTSQPPSPRVSVANSTSCYSWNGVMWKGDAPRVPHATWCGRLECIRCEK